MCAGLLGRPRHRGRGLCAHGASEALRLHDQDVAVERIQYPLGRMTEESVLGQASRHGARHQTCARFSRRGEPAFAVLAEIGRTPTDLLVIGKREPTVPHAQHGAMGGVGFRIAYHASTDVLVLSS